ncbi:MAG: DUF1638 domain-containing protein [Chloroflexi bacterium]|nr:MAG: DUF1638 domain-containing protein [Chloroflexota bacterium]
MRTAFIICGALAREVLAIIARHGWDAEVVGVPALDHVHPERIAPDVEKRLLELREQYDRVIVVFGDCGSRGALDAVLARYGIERVAGPHCYEMYGGPLFHELMAENPGTFFLTDFLVRTFQGTVIRELGLDRFPHLRDEYFRNYKRIVYLAQTHDPELCARAEEIAGYLGLPLEIRHTGYGLLEERLVALMDRGDRGLKIDHSADSL